MKRNADYAPPPGPPPARRSLFAYHFERVGPRGYRCLHCGRLYRKPGAHIRGHLKWVHGIGVFPRDKIVAPARAAPPRNAT